MKSVRRQQKDIDKARGHLIKWATGSQEGISGIERTIAELVTSVVQHSGYSRLEVETGLARGPFGEATRIQAMFNWLTTEAADGSKAPLARYIAERGWRESPVGKRWLLRLAESHFELRDIITVTPGASLRLGAPSNSGKPVTVHEPHLADSHVQGLCLFARVLPMPAGAVLADGLLMFDPPHIKTLSPPYQLSAVFALWATHALLSEGYLASEPKPRSRQPWGSQPSSGVPHEPPPDTRPSSKASDEPAPSSTAEPSQASQPQPLDAKAREKLLARVRNLFAMAQETEASPHEAEIALRRCQSLMAKFGITEKDLETSEFGRQNAHTGKRVPMHIQFLSIAVGKLHGVLFVTGGSTPAHFRGYEIDVQVARLTLDYLKDSVERALTARRRTGEFPPGRMAAYDYRLAFAHEVVSRVNTIVNERKAQEQANSTTGTALTVKKLEIVRRECGKDLTTNTVRGRGAVDEAAAGAGREDGSRVSLDPQVGSGSARPLLDSV